jgi:hypothetical protein
MIAQKTRKYQSNNQFLQGSKAFILILPLIILTFSLTYLQVVASPNILALFSGIPSPMKGR